MELPAPPDPERAFRAALRRRAPFFLDTALPMEGIGRLSLLGWDPFLTLSCKADRITVADARGVRQERGDPFDALRGLLRRYRVAGRGCAGFAGAAVGFLGYDLCHFIERLPGRAVDDIGLPDLFMAFHDTAVVWDRAAGRAWVAAVDAGASERPSAAERASECAARLREAPLARVAGPARRGAVECNFADDAYRHAIRRCKDYIAAGDIFQVNMSRRFRAELGVPPWELYLRLRGINPAPMAGYLAGEDWAVVSASPELFLRLEGDRVETRPIKGTRRRSGNPAEDADLARELLASEKDAAELAMIVDLERNDLGRVCRYGSVQVTAPRQLQSFPTVHHLVATVEGRLRADRDAMDLIAATFPGGSITGAPKIRAMEIIDELEPTRRGVYTGAIGMFGFDGGVNLNIAIRTLCARNGSVFFQAGGGIVADSDPQLELEETAHKAEALIRALDIV
jgi:para-aminobenzoate synthetase component 1